MAPAMQEDRLPVQQLAILCMSLRPYLTFPSHVSLPFPPVSNLSNVSCCKFLQPISMPAVAVIGEGEERRLFADKAYFAAICRFAEPVALTNANPYLPEMIESFGVKRDEVAKWAGLTSAIFSAAQCLTAMLWVRGTLTHSQRFNVSLTSQRLPNVSVSH